MPAPFLVLAGRLCEANLFRGAHAAWFAGPRVLADGGLTLVTPVDPLLLVLPLLEAARRQARPVCLLELPPGQELHACHAALCLQYAFVA